jgi:hypothetical protein
MTRKSEDISSVEVLDVLFGVGGGTCSFDVL